jgi:hypothetical protein
MCVVLAMAGAVQRMLRRRKLLLSDLLCESVRLNVKTLLRMNSDSGAVEAVLGHHRNSESFKGLNEVCFDELGRQYFTDQGQSGLHDPMGRVYRLRTDGGLD